MAFETEATLQRDDAKSPAHQPATKEVIADQGSSREEQTSQKTSPPTLDELLPVIKHLAPSWGDSVSIRGIRAYLATHGFFAGLQGTVQHLHDLETTVRLPEAPACRVIVFLPRKGAADKKVAQDERKGVVMHFHGGGWSICNAEMEAAICRHLSDTLGCIVVAPDYAKAPELYFPHALRQAHGLLNWISAPVEDDGLGRFLQTSMGTDGDRASLKVNTASIALTGGSSGGNIAAAATLLTQHIPLKNNAKVVALGLQYPGLDLAKPYDEKFSSLKDKLAILPPPWASKLFLRCFLPCPYDTEEKRASPWISPGRASDEEVAKFPPTWIVTADNDHYRLESESFAQRLRNLGVTGGITVLDDVAHGFDIAHVSDGAAKKQQETARSRSWTALSDHLRQYL